MPLWQAAHSAMSACRSDHAPRVAVQTVQRGPPCLQVGTAWLHRQDTAHGRHAAHPGHPGRGRDRGVGAHRCPGSGCSSPASPHGAAAWPVTPACPLLRHAARSTRLEGARPCLRSCRLSRRPDPFILPDRAALFTAGTASAYLPLVFMRDRRMFDRFYTFRGAAARDFAAWRDALLWFLKVAPRGRWCVRPGACWRQLLMRAFAAALGSVLLWTHKPMAAALPSLHTPLLPPLPRTKKVTFRWSRSGSGSCSGASGGQGPAPPKPLLIKSPVHTARVALLLRLFPRARFVYVHRDPLTTFASAAHMANTYYWWAGQGPGCCCCWDHGWRARLVPCLVIPRQAAIASRHALHAPRLCYTAATLPALALCPTGRCLAASRNTPPQVLLPAAALRDRRHRFHTGPV